MQGKPNQGDTGRVAKFSPPIAPIAALVGTRNNSDMDTQAVEILQTALGLPPNDRAEIAALLLQSLDDGADSDVEADVEAAWAEEIKRRIDSIDSGQATWIPSDQVKREMRELLDG